MPWKDLTVVSIREEFVLRALEPRSTLAVLCREYGISRKTGYKWIERYKESGTLGLRDLTRRPLTSPLRVSAEVVVELIALRNAHPRWGARKLIWALERGGARPIPSERTVNRILERTGLIVRRRVRSSGQQPEVRKPDARAETSNALWTADYKGWWRTGDFKRCEPLTVRDQFSRFVLAAHVCRSPELGESRRLFERLFELYGVPERILTDNGSPFVAMQSRFGLTRLSAWWIALGIEPIRTRPATPADNGAHERLHRDIALEVEAVGAGTPEEQQRVLDAWRADFNNNRPHESLGMKTPAQVYKPNAKTYAGAKVELVYPDRMLVRTVSGSGSIRIESRMVQLTSALAGYTIAIDPQTGPPHEVWFGQHRLGWINLATHPPTVTAELPLQACPKKENRHDTKPETNPILETA